MPAPDVTVVIPARGPGPHLAAAIASAQAEEPAEVLVVEDGTEGVEKAVLGTGRLIRLPHVGRSRARNIGVENARTTFVAFLDEDDQCLPGRLDVQRSTLLAHPAATMCYGQVTAVDAAGAALAGASREFAARYRKLVERGSTFDAIVELGGPLYTSATMVRRETFIAHGGFDPAFDAYEDLDLYLRLARQQQLVPCPEGALTAYRLHSGNTSSDALYRGTLGVTAKHLPTSTGRARRLLLAKRVDALWGLGEFGPARREALAAARSEPALLREPPFLKRLLGLALPLRLLEARR